MRPAEFQGEWVTVVPYVRGHYERDFLYKLWLLIEQAGDWDKLFWGATPEPFGPISRHGDLADFINFITDTVDPKAVLLVVADGKPIGLIWFNRIQSESAFGSIWMEPGHRGKATREAINLGMEFAFYERGWKTLFALTPWALARNALKRCGWQQAAIIPAGVEGPIAAFLLTIKEQGYHG